jgi:hypothetical protein
MHTAVVATDMKQQIRSRLKAVYRDSTLNDIVAFAHCSRELLKPYLK